MKLKGNWDGTKTYDVGDIALYTDGVFYHLQNPCAAGTAPVDTRYWGKLGQVAAEAASMIMDMTEELNAKIPDNIDKDSILLNSSTPDSKKQFIITVDDDGEISADEFVEE